MNTISVHDIQRDPLNFVHRIEDGEDLLVMRDNQPLAEIKPVPRPQREPRPLGLCAGIFTVPADFDAPLPEDILKEFEV